MRYHVLLLLASCGRVGFEPAAGSVDAAVDPGIDAATIIDCSTVPDGTACDDRNVCTAAASCMAGACMVPSPMAACTVADSADDFTVDAQGSGGWWYGFWIAGNDVTYDPDSDFQLGVWGTDAYVPATIDGTYLYIAWWGTHPDDSPVVHTVRRWVSDVSGPAVVTVSMHKVDTTCGDGVDGRLVVDGVSLWSRTFAFDDKVGVAMPIAVTLEVGSRVELLVGALTDDSCDTTETTVTIASP